MSNCHLDRAGFGHLQQHSGLEIVRVFRSSAFLLYLHCPQNCTTASGGVRTLKKDQHKRWERQILLDQNFGISI